MVTAEDSNRSFNSAVHMEIRNKTLLEKSLGNLRDSS